MPTYQYVCTECGRDLEVQQSFSEASLTECPTCSGRLRKVFNAVGVVFKGSGFYRNDSRSGGSSDAGGDAGAKDSTDPGGKDSGSNDSGSKDSGGAKESSSTTTPAKDAGASSTTAKASASSTSSS